MNRTFVEISPDSLKERIEALMADEKYSKCGLRNLIAHMGRDIKVSFDLENSTMDRSDYETGSESNEVASIHGIFQLDYGAAQEAEASEASEVAEASKLTLWGMSAGGDWESPVWFCFYFDGRSIRAYVPKNGNPWNTCTNKAYGNDKETDLKDFKKRWPETYKDVDMYEFDKDETSTCEFDPALIKKELLERFKLKGAKFSASVSTSASPSLPTPSTEPAPSTSIRSDRRKMRTLVGNIQSILEACEYFGLKLHLKTGDDGRQSLELYRGEGENEVKVDVELMP